MSVVIHEREQDDHDVERYTKRIRLAEEGGFREGAINPNPLVTGHVLPQSHTLLEIPLPIAEEGEPLRFRELDVGISEYIGQGEAKIEGIIKQRFTDFLVFEVDLDDNVIHLKSLGKPDSPGGGDAGVLPVPVSTDAEVFPNLHSQVWPEHFNAALGPFLDEGRIAQLRGMYVEGRDPPRKSDSGWAQAGRKARTVDEGSTVVETIEPTLVVTTENKDRRGMGAKPPSRAKTFKREDNRKVISQPMASKETRTSFHKTIRELFSGQLETETDMTGDVCCVMVKWANGPSRGLDRRRDAAGRGHGTHHPYIHFTMQKTNRDTQDALGHLSRLLHVGVKVFSVAGTKDKRGVTVQRVSMLRHKKTIEDVWKLANGIGTRKTVPDASSQRGERGVRIADLEYCQASLELGMLKGNAFVITLRNVKVSSMQILDESLNTLKTKGFINYYGMQRFGTASVPTHSVGLALLKSEWQRAADLILQKRQGEHPDVEAARDAWLKERDLDKALSLFPKRVVAERCILESFKKQKGDTRNVMGAISTIPKNLRLMYIHAYQSYVWNAIVSERIRLYGCDRPVVGDLVFEGEEDTSKMEVDIEVDVHEDARRTAEISNNACKRSQNRFIASRVRTLTEDDLDTYTIFDVVMPLPGTEVAFPGGQLGVKYRQFLRMDGLDPDDWKRKQREYTLTGSYRKILHIPREMSWSALRYTDPDVPLAQADEDRLLGFEPPALVEDGRFMALQIRLVLGTAAYATMALREVTKMDTSSHVQSSLTQSAEDQVYRGGNDEAAEG